MEIKLDFKEKAPHQAAGKQDSAIELSSAAKQASAILTKIEPWQGKRVPLLKCGTVMLQNFEEEYGEPGRQLMLVREPDNKYDRWATKVCTLSGTMLGYLPAWKNQSVARLMDAGKTVTAFVDEYSHIHERGYFIRSNESPQLPLVLYLEIEGRKEN